MTDRGGHIPICNQRGFTRIGQCGFTLIEMCIVVVICSIILITGVSLYKVYRQTVYNTDVETRMREVQTALENYFYQRGVLPCPAGPAFPLNSAGHGAPQCGGGNGLLTPGTPVVHAVANPIVLIGAVPARALGLPSSDMEEPNGHLLIYAVTQSMTQYGGGAPITLPDGTSVVAPNQTQGAIEVRDPTVTDPATGQPLSMLKDSPYGPGSALYALISPGRGGCGVYGNGGQLGQPCAAGGYEEENAFNGKIDTIFFGGSSNAYSTR